MWGSIKNIVANYCYNQEETDTKSSDDIDGWVFVDKSGREIEKEELDLLEGSTKIIESRLNPLPLLDISNTSSSQSSPQLSPTKIEEGWFVTPPPCFTLNCPGVIEISPLEDLLIEHPSMSVYGQIPNIILHDSLYEENLFTQPSTDVSTEVCTPDYRKDFASTPVSKLCTKNETVQNKCYSDITGLSNHHENKKPAQQAKWENDQYKLCPSYMTRQNRVHRYQSRKHNQKKKSLAKPFAEKGRRNF